ncbi:pH-inducible protein involved in stress response (putative kinase) [Escherichia coli]|uniref:pH-inducible protein involved in stress response (Putative kinase) n=1 Tax=Escherichia coli TaxID=562 RepID=A0A2X1MYX7_ECOLX|nr:pH-inducible protein involved in stress response (putative kinase) [Escherichia coli]
MLKAVALAFKKMHSINRQHGCCYVRHIYVKTEGNAEAGFLDLEKSRRACVAIKRLIMTSASWKKYLEPIPKADWEQVKAYYYAM